MSYIRVKIKSFHCHENFDSKTLHNDICLIILERAVWEVSEFISLSGIDEPPPREKESATVLGWGFTSEHTKTPSDWLRSVSLH